MATIQDLENLSKNPNVRKFLELLSYTEGTQKNGYYTAFGGGRLPHLNDHPRYLKTFKQTDGKINKTSAAGRYQFLRGTWDGLAKQYDFKDFSPKNQDLGAIALLIQNGAIPHLLKGDFSKAVSKAGGTWQSLPSSTDPQPKRSWANVNKFLGSNITMQEQPSLSNAQNIKLYRAYKDGKMNAQQMAEYEHDVNAGIISLPKNAKLRGNEQKNTKTQGEVLPYSVVRAYNDGKMNAQQMAELEFDVKSGIAILPRGLELQNPKSKGFLGRSADKIKSATNQSFDNIDDNYGLANIGGALDTALSVGGGLINDAIKGNVGLIGGTIGALQGKGFAESAEGTMDNFQNSKLGRAGQWLATPRTETGEKYADVLAIPADAMHQAGEVAYETTGSPVLGAGLETGLNLASMLFPLRARSRSGALHDGVVHQADDVARKTDDVIKTAEELTPPNPKPPTAFENPPTVNQMATERSTGSLDGIRANLDNANQQETATRQAIDDLNTTPQPNYSNAKSSIAEYPELKTETPQPDINAKPANIEHLLDIDASKPKTGGVAIDVQGLRADVLKQLGFDDAQIRQGAITGDITQLEREKALSKIDTETGRDMRAQFDTEYHTMNKYVESIIEDDIGARAGASPESRGQVVIDALQNYKDWYREQVKADYAKADEAMAGKGGIMLDDFAGELATDHNWSGKASNQQLRQGINSYLKKMNLIDKGGELKPMTAQQAEGLRQYVNSQYSHDSAGLIGKINESIDMGVFKALDDNAYINARKRYREYKEMFENPKGVAQLLDIDGINQKVSAENVGKKLQQLAAKDGKQFDHIYGLLDNLPDKLKPQGKRAKAEIQASIAENIFSKGGLKSINKEYMQYRRTNNDGSHKAQKIFGDEVSKKIDTYIAGRNILQHHDANPSGTATATKNLDKWDIDTGNKAVDRATTGAINIIEGVPIVGKFAGEKIKSSLVEQQNRRQYEQTLNPERVKVYRKANDKLIEKVISTNEMQAIINEFEKTSPNETKIRALQKALSKKNEWQSYVKTLPKKAQATLARNADVMFLLTQGANSHDDIVSKPTF